MLNVGQLTGYAIKWAPPDRSHMVRVSAISSAIVEDVRKLVNRGGDDGN
jgi:hypothetical protein